MNVVIIGAGGHGRVVLDILRLAGHHTPVGFIDADASLANTTVAGLPVLGPVNLLDKLRRQDVRGAVVAIGDNRIRSSYAELVGQCGLELVNAIHLSAVISSTVQLGRNTVIAAGAVVGTDARIADSVIINTSAVVDHECRIGSAVHICPGVLLAGRVVVEDGAFVGLGAKVLPCLRIGLHAIVGAGAVVLEDVPAAATVVGVPARVIKLPTAIAA
ncbi:MAG: acetyltransferase [Planctomycetota bacterium]|nr:acetyltransferase [Planctomycetota bacterium]